MNADFDFPFSHWSALSGAPDTPENYHIVTFDLMPHGEHTNVTLTQSNLTGGVKPSDIKHRAEYEKNWRGVLDGLAKRSITDKMNCNCAFGTKRTSGSAYNVRFLRVRADIGSGRCFDKR